MQQNDDENVENYEKNLKLSYDAIRKDYEITLTHIIPTQKNLIKTYLWLDSFILGICFLLLKEKSTTVIVLICLFLTLVFCVVSMGYLLYALYHNKPKQFIFFEPKQIAKIKNDKWSHAQCLINAICATKEAFDFNSKIVEFRATHIRKGGKLLFLSFLFFALTTLFISYNYYNTSYRKEVIVMADDKQQPVEPDESGVTKSFLSTNNKQVINTESINESVKIKKDTEEKPTNDSNCTKDKK